MVMNNNRIAMLMALGLALLISAATYSYVEQGVNVSSVVLMLLGVSTLVMGFVLNLKSGQKPIGTTNSRDVKLGLPWKRVGLVFATISLSILFLVSVNYLAHRMPQRWDVTRDNQHTLSQATIDFVAGLVKPIELTAFYVGLAPKYLEDLLNEYKRISGGKISVKIVDPIDDIAYAAKFGNVISGAESKLIAVSGDEREDVDFSDVALSEEQVSNALARVSREPRQAYFLTGHGEFSRTDENNEGLSQFADLLNLNNISTDNLMLGIEKRVPEDCDVLIIAGPRLDLTAHEQSLLEDYLEQGGDALFLIEAAVINNSSKVLTSELGDKGASFNSILNQWGLSVGNDMVIDLNSHVGEDVGSPATRNYIDHKAITAGLDYTFYIRPRSLTVLQNRRETIKLAPIALTASKEQSWAETDNELTIHFDEGLDTPGPIAISYVLWEEKAKGDESDTRIIAFSDADFLSNAYLKQYSNAAMGMNVVNWLSELDYAVFLDQKKVEVERLDLTSKQKRMMSALLFLMPLLIALFGIGVWMRRRT